MANSGKVFLHAVGGQEKPSEFVEVTGPTFDVAAHASLKKHGCDVAVVVCAAAATAASSTAQCSYRQSHALSVKVPSKSYNAPTIKFSRF